MPTPPFEKVRPFSNKFRQDLNQIGEAALSWEEEKQTILSRIAALEAAAPVFQPFTAILNIAKLIPGQTNRWAYGWEEFMPGLAPSSFGFPGCGSAANGSSSSWEFQTFQRSSWGGDQSSYAATHPYQYYAINLAEVSNSEVAAGADGFVSYGQKIGTGPAGTGTVELTSIGNVADTTEANRRSVLVTMNAYQLLPLEGGTNWYNGPKLYPNDVPDNGYKGRIMFAFSAGNEVEVTCT